MSEFFYKTKLFEEVAEHIVERIRSQQWPAGMRLPSEPELAKYFEVSRSTVRLAIKSLQGSGVLHSRVGSGTYVTENAPLMLATRELATAMADPENLCALVQARYILEPQLAALAAQNAAPDEVAKLLEIVQEMQSLGDRMSLMTSGYRFHEAVAKAAHNAVLYGFYQSAAKQLQTLRFLETLSTEIYLDGIREHSRIAEAIARKDGRAAKQEMRAHLKKDYAGYLNKSEVLE